MTITASAVKTLRERTGAGMMECKKALVETGGDLDAAAEMMRKAGLAKADKKVGRIAAEGAVAIGCSADGRNAAIVEVNSETDFVARQADFQQFAGAIAQTALDSGSTGLAEILKLTLPGGTDVEQTRRELIARLGEKIEVRRVAGLVAPTRVGTYVHGTRIGVLVGLDGGDETLAHDLAMHIAAASPQCVAPDEVPAAQVDKEREILAAQAALEGKPPEIITKMVEGRIRKYLAEICLVGQPFVKDPDTTVEKLLKAAGAKVTGFVRFEVGEGIEKRQDNFADEVLAQVNAAEGRA
jgi:elongation factor Ts